MAQLNINALAEMMSQTANKSIGGVARGIKDDRSKMASRDAQTATQQYALEQAKLEQERKAAEDDKFKQETAALQPYLLLQPLMDGALTDANGDGVVDDKDLAVLGTSILQASLSNPFLPDSTKATTEKAIAALNEGSASGDFQNFMGKVKMAQQRADHWYALGRKEMQPYSTEAMQKRAENRFKERELGMRDRAIKVQEAQLNKPESGFSLGEGQQRYDADGNLVAENKKAPSGQFSVGQHSGSTPQAPQTGQQGGAAIPPDLAGKDIIDLATGIGSTVQSGLESFSPTSEMASGELNVQAKQYLGGIAKQLESAYVNNPRVPVSEREQMQALGLTDVQGSLFKSASSIRAKFDAAIPLMERRLAEELRLANDPESTTKVRGDAQLSAQQLYSALSNMKAVMSNGQEQRDQELNSLLDKYAPREQ